MRIDLLIPPHFDLPATRLADWLELYVLTTEYKECPVEKLWEAMELPEDAYPDDGEEDKAKEQLLSRVYTEFERRMEALNESYPFEISNDGSSIVLKPDLNPGMLSYNLSLRISIKMTGIVADGVLPDITNNERELFQGCANLAAAGYLGGRVYAFGWPRPDHTNLLNALKAVEEEMGGEGIVQDAPPIGAPAQSKDDELDVFAWLPHCDGPGWALTLWGQVASGLNWLDKPLSSNKICQFRLRWYKRPPVLEPIRAMFVPFCLFEDELEKGMEVYKATLIDRTVIYGIIFHRCRLPLYTHRAFNSQYEVEGLGIVNKDYVREGLETWWNQFCDILRDAAAAEAA